MEILGIDIGGTGIKGAPVDIEKGKLTAERYRIPTPQPSVPDAVADVVAQIVKHFDRALTDFAYFPGDSQYAQVGRPSNSGAFEIFLAEVCKLAW